MNGKLPWRLRADMAYFKQLTRSTRDPLKRNAVVMGRKTWQSIPDKFRPLDDRLNVVITRSKDAKLDLAIPDGVLIADSLEGALRLLAEADSVETVFVIGGASVYESALRMGSACERILVTEIETEPNNAPAFDCDTFFPPLADGFVREQASDAKMEGELRYRFVEYRPSAGTSDPPSPTAALSPPSDAGRPTGDGTPVGNPTHGSPNMARRVHEEEQYLDLVRDVIENGVVRGDRTGTGTLSKFGAQMRFSLRESFPLLTTKSVFWRGVAEELLWFLNGETSAAKLQEKKIHIWDGNSAREYLDSIGLTDREEGDLGPVYGWQWRHFGAEYKDMHTDYTGQGVDQVADVLDKIKNKPNDRRIIMTAWNPSDLHKMALPPCHMFAQFYVANGELSCQMYQRSADLGLGVPFNIASYALLTCIFAHLTGLKRGDFIHTIGDAHVYLNHVDALKQQLQREPRPFPTLDIADTVTSIESCTFADFTLTGYKPHGKIEMKMAV